MLDNISNPYSFLVNPNFDPFCGASDEVQSPEERKKLPDFFASVHAAYVTSNGLYTDLELANTQRFGGKPNVISAGLETSPQTINSIAAFALTNAPKGLQEIESTDIEEVKSEDSGEVESDDTEEVESYCTRVPNRFKANKPKPTPPAATVVLGRKRKGASSSHDIEKPEPPKEKKRRGRPLKYKIWTPEMMETFTKELPKYPGQEKFKDMIPVMTQSHDKLIGIDEKTLKAMFYRASRTLGEARKRAEKANRRKEARQGRASSLPCSVDLAKSPIKDNGDTIFTTDARQKFSKRKEPSLSGDISETRSSKVHKSESTQWTHMAEEEFQDVITLEEFPKTTSEKKPEEKFENLNDAMRDSLKELYQPQQGIKTDFLSIAYKMKERHQELEHTAIEIVEKMCYSASIIIGSQRNSERLKARKRNDSPPTVISLGSTLNSGDALEPPPKNYNFQGKMLKSFEEIYCEHQAIPDSHRDDTGKFLKMGFKMKERFSQLGDIQDVEEMCRSTSLKLASIRYKQRAKAIKNAEKEMSLSGLPLKSTFTGEF